MSLLRITLRKLCENIVVTGQSCEHLIPTYSALTLSGYIIFGYLNRYVKYEAFYDDTWLRALSITLLISLLTCTFLNKNYKINKLALFLFWFLTVVINQSFFFSFMVLQNDFNQIWSLNAIISYSFLFIIFDWVTAFALISVGIFSAILLFLFMDGSINCNNNFIMFASAFISLIIYGALFSYKRKTQEEMKTALDNLTYQSAAIAHEMRTPLGNINMIGHTLKSIMARYKTENAAFSRQILITNKDIISLEHLTSNLRETVKGAQTFIDLMLANLKQDVSNLPCSKLSMKECIEKAMSVYPFTEQEQNLIHLRFEDDFTFLGNEDFFQHVIFNLLKNSLYFIHAAHKGEIFIYIQTSKKENNLIFKDTGPGIEPKKLINIFKPFYSSRPHGTGIGLAFCKKVVESFGGKIRVESQWDAHTTFIISFLK